MESGGYIQQIEIQIEPKCDDGTFPPDSYLKEFSNFAQLFDESTGKAFTISKQMKEHIADAGFVDIQQLRFKLPLGQWSSDPKYREIGRWFESFYRTGSQGWVVGPLTRTMGWTLDQVNEACQKAYSVLEERNQHIYFDAVVIYGRRP